MSQFRVPLLKDHPLIGWLFQSKGNASQFDHVLVFITPTRLDPVLIHKLPDLNMLQKPLQANTE